LFKRGAFGVNVAYVPEGVTVPSTAAPPVTLSVKVVVLIVLGFIVWLKVALRIWLVGTSMAPFKGVVVTTRGAGATVVKDHTKGPISSAPPGAAAAVVIVAV
jgi:hypothetical protein